MTEYGFSEGNEFFPKLGETSEQGGRPAIDYLISIDMAKQICMIQRSPEGKQIRQYFIDLEKAWNTPEQIALYFQVHPSKIFIFNLLESNYLLCHIN